jgi:hypothetical protein
MTQMRVRRLVEKKPPVVRFCRLKTSVWTRFKRPNRSLESCGMNSRTLNGLPSRALVSRTRCSVFYAAPQSRDPTSHRLRMGPGSAAHHAAKKRRAAQHPGHER